jgi:uncharacterized protein YndB with AHSA1/START domain
MPSARREVVINRPPAEVFDFFTDPANETRWRIHVKEASASGPVGVGSRIHQVVKGPGGRGIPADIEVTAHERPDRYAFKVVAGPVRPTGQFLFAGEGSTTTVSFALEAQLSGLKKLLMSGAVQKSMDSEMQALDRAKSLLENP